MSESKEGTRRRDVLKLAGLGAPVAAVAAATGAPADAAVVEVGDGLRKTAHVQKYLDSCRF